MNTSVACNVSPRMVRPPHRRFSGACHAASCARSAAVGHSAKNTRAVAWSSECSILKRQATYEEREGYEEKQEGCSGSNRYPMQLSWQSLSWFSRFWPPLFSPPWVWRLLSWQQG